MIALMDYQILYNKCYSFTLIILQYCKIKTKITYPHPRKKLRCPIKYVNGVVCLQ